MAMCYHVHTTLKLHWLPCCIGRRALAINRIVGKNHMPTYCTIAKNMKSDEENILQLRRVVLLCKITRYDYERHLHPKMSEEQLQTFMTSKGSDFKALKERDQEYKRQVNYILDVFRKFNVEVKVVLKFNYAEKLVEWADAIFTAGGDGTFLMAASKVRGRSKPVIGINTDPLRSEGYLCLSKKHSNNFEKALEQIINGKFRWQWRQRICITMSGKYETEEVVDLHQQQVLYPEHRFIEHVQENELHRRSNEHKKDQPRRELSVLALNEVFIGESLSARVSFCEVSIDDSVRQKQKSSGITVCTGTGSTSWFFNINHLTTQSVHDILMIAQKYGICETNKHLETNDIQHVTDAFNASLSYHPSDPKMAYTIRDPITNVISSIQKSRGFCTKMSILSRMWDGWVVVDGSLSLPFNDGAVVELTIREKDALQCVILD